MDWGASLINRIAICADAVLFIFFLNRFISIAPFLFEGLLRSRRLEHLEDSVSRTRDRNSVAAISLPALALLFSRYDIYSPSFMDGFTPGERTLTLLGVLVLTLILREALIRVLAPSRGDRENYMLSARVIYDFLITGTVILAAVAGLGAIFGIKDLIVRGILFWTGIVIYFLFLLSRTQILRNSCNQFAAFLYLCTLELIPAGTLVATGIFL